MVQLIILTIAEEHIQRIFVIARSDKGRGIAAIEQRAASALSRRLQDQTHNRHRSDRLAVPGLADDRQQLDSLDVEVHAVHSTVDAVEGSEMVLQTLD